LLIGRSTATAASVSRSERRNFTLNRSDGLTGRSGPLRASETHPSLRVVLQLTLSAENAMAIGGMIKFRATDAAKPKGGAIGFNRQQHA